MADRRLWTFPARRESARPDGLRCDAPIAVIRSRGEVRLSFGQRAGRTRAYETFQSGCMRARLVQSPDEAPCAVLLNTSGGLTGGDRIAQSTRWDFGAQASVTTQAAEKVYRALDESVRIDMAFDVADEAQAEWLPQETILFDRAKLSRRADVRLSARASFLSIEALVFGRAAMNERMNTGSVRDAWRIYRDNKLIFAETIHLDGDVDARLQRKSVGAGARAAATLIHVASDAADHLPRLREVMETAEGKCAASAWNGLLVARFLAPDAETLRADALAALNVVRGGRDMPRVWAC